MNKPIKPLNLSSIFRYDFLDAKAFYVYCYHPLSMVDAALMRKGRLIAKYEFGKLGADKAQQLSKHFGYDTEIREPMTVAEIINQHEKQYVPSRVEVIGFRRTVLEN